MPAYELLCLYKAFERPQLVKAIKRHAEVILQRGGIIRGFENLGFNALPFKMKKNTEIHTHANYVLIKFDVPTKETKYVEKEFANDLDLLRSTISPLKEDLDKTKVDCVCIENGSFIKDRVNYLRPISVNNRRKLFHDYTVRL